MYIAPFKRNRVSKITVTSEVRDEFGGRKLNFCFKFCIIFFICSSVSSLAKFTLSMFLNLLTNVFIASNLTTRHSGLGEQPVSFATMGGEHERYRNPDVEHQIPISHAMAYYGFNVVVVNQAFN